MNQELIPQIEPLVQHLKSWEGSLIEVVEQLTRNPGSLNRHSTTRSSFFMQIDFVGMAFSGASLMLMGNAMGREVGYQATFDLLEELTVSLDQVVFVEHFGKVAERHSTFSLVDENLETNTDVVNINDD